MRILILTENYPDNNGNKSMNYVHTRNKYYSKEFDLTVVSFSANSEYIVEGIHVIPINLYNKKNNYYDILVCHAPNLKHHYLFIKKYGKYFKKQIIFFHGHEILKINKYYPQPYYYKEKNKFKNLIQNVYDDIKITLWKKLIEEEKDRNYYIFVSNTLKKYFLKEALVTKINNSYVINNSVGEYFEKESYNLEIQKKYDFITIRNNIDESTYCIDLVYELAKIFKEKNFLIVGKGAFFKYHKKLKNITLIQNELSHSELGNLIDKSKYGLMPTRHDSQGVMSCEMATYGIPVITSNIDVCREIFDDFNNVFFVNNEIKDMEVFIRNIINDFNIPFVKNNHFFAENTVFKEIELFKKLRGS